MIVRVELSTMSDCIDVCENYVGSVYIGGYGGLSESGLLCLP